MIYYCQKQLTIPYVFFRSSYGEHKLPEITDKLNPILKDKISIYKTFQFSIVIENSRQYNYFTEKLVDCLLTKTIPIYYGAQNINKYFDTNGWIILKNENIKNCIDKINKLSSKHYSKYLDTIENNYKTCKEKYTIWYTNRYNKILKTLPEFQ